MGRAIFEPTLKRKGRPARREKEKKARAALEGLKEWIEEDETDPGVWESEEALVEYRESKGRMLDGNVSLGGREAVVERLKTALAVQDSKSVEEMMEKGILGLV